ncbi:MAG: hypothetical protein KDD53_00525 [Bdellovibrionales bacterium]|nr:hypothetical protein [Bdellovibrionales bacterium]
MSVSLSSPIESIENGVDVALFKQASKVQEAVVSTLIEGATEVSDQIRSQGHPTGQNLDIVA